ncbi:MAG TPA: PSD1 and planctomycete cytochrome C domain-containing protein, partial [Planctomycetota bacterium]|nr:PSD1 and planctomycete cytochrome C domain-containing protein [Planctomycetota bacterium]
MRAAFTILAMSALALQAGELPPAAAREVDFEKDIQPIFAKNCYSCHGPRKQKGDYRLDLKASALKGGEHVNIVPGKSAESPLIHLVAELKTGEVMPPDGETLSNEQIGLLRAWIDQGAKWPEHLAGVAENKLDWWSLRPLAKPQIPAVPEAQKAFIRTPIDAFVLAAQSEKKLSPSPEADRRTLLRRLYFDLTGLPPTYEEVLAFEKDSSPDAYDRVVEKLLASPRYGERWARHWMDVVHFAETHGHDQDRIRPNAWPYRDYLIAAFNNDTPYARFIQEQLAADVLFPDEPQLTPALGFIAAGPWDESSLRDIREDSLCRQIGYYLDRDDMVMQTMSTFTSSTVHCARCHDHKFDPISQKDYYALQAVFAGLGRADRAYDPDPKIHAQRRSLLAVKNAIERKDAAQIEAQLQPPLKEELHAWTNRHRAALRAKPEWTVLEISRTLSQENVELLPQPDGSLLASGLTPDTDTYTFTVRTPLKGITGVRLELLPDESLPHKGPGRQIDNGNLHLSEFLVHAAPQDAPEKPQRIPVRRAVADFNQASWTIEHAIDGKMESAWGIFPETGKPHWAVFEFKEPLKDNSASLTLTLQQNHGRKHVIGRLRLSVTNAPHPAGKSELPDAIGKLLLQDDAALSPAQKLEISAYFLKNKIEQQLAALPKPSLVYAGAKDFVADGTHRPVAKPRPVHELRRGDILKPGELARPGALSAISGLPGRFELADSNDEGQRRAALAKWISAPGNPLTWRSIVNRVWQYHFGRGLASMPNDFGRMGAPPTHPELLDFLAATFMEGGGSLKSLHRLIVHSAVYRQSSQHNAANAAIDSDNHF